MNTCPTCGADLLGSAICDRCFLDNLMGDRDELPSVGGGKLTDTTPTRVLLAPESARHGKFVADRRLGTGGMGDVWRAWDLELGRWVALKILRHDDLREIARFVREAQTAARLNHPNIAAIFEAGEADGRHFIAMQLIEGDTLRTAPRDDIRRTAAAIRDAALAVHHAHEEGVVHRDLKPANLMLGRDGRLYVLDFGLARQTEIESSLSISGSVMGTPAYMPPEQAKGRIRDVDARSDVYSLGATLYELLTDREPFRGDGIYEVLHQVVNSDPKPVRRRNPRIHRDLETIVMKCMEKDPKDRYPTAKDLAEDLTRYLNGEAILAHPPSITYRLLKFVTRRKAIVGLAAGGVLAVGLTLALLVPELVVAHREAEREEHARIRDRFYGQAEADLNLLRMRFYKPGFRLRNRDFEEYESLAVRIRARMADEGEDARGWYLIGRCRHVVWNLSGAISAFDRALRLDPEHASTLLHKARVLIILAVESWLLEWESREREIMDEAMRLFERVRNNDMLPEIERDFARGYMLLIEGDKRKTIRHCRETIESRNGEDFVEEFHLIHAMADDQDGVRSADTAIRIRPAFFEAYFWRSVWHRKRGARMKSLEDQLLQEDKGLADVRTAIRINPRFSLAHVELAASLHHKGRLLERLGRIEERDRAWQESLSAVEASLRMSPDDSLALTYRGTILGTLNRFDEATADFVRALERDPENLRARINLGEVQSRLKNFDRAIAELDRALKRDPDSFEAWNRRGIVLAKMGDLKSAADDFRRSAKLSPAFLPARRNLGRALTNLGDHEGGIREFTAVLALDPSDAEMYFERGFARQAIGRRDEGIADFTKTIQLNPGNRLAWFNRANLLYANGRLEDSVRDYSEFFRRGGEGFDARIYRGKTWLELHKPDRALEDFEVAARLAPRSASAFDHRGISKMLLGDLDGAELDFTESLRLGSKNPEVHARRGHARAKQGRFAAAREDLEQALRLAPKNWSGRASVQRQLDRLNRH